MNLPELYRLYKKYRVVTTDTRSITGPCIFFALRGPNFDGNKFAGEALSKGAAYAIVDNRQFASDSKYIQVDNGLVALQQLATYHRVKCKFKILAITGSNGKTTTKELIIRILNKKYKTEGTQGNLNNHIGVPLTLLSFHEQTEIGIIEMGANHPGEIENLCKIASPDLGLITNIGKAHLEGFGSLEGVAQAKSELYRFLEKHNGGVMINKSNPKLMDYLPANLKPVVTYGIGSDTMVEGKITSADPCLSFRIRLSESYSISEVDFNTRLIGKYNLENALAAIATGLYFNVPVESIKEAIESYSPDNNRSQFLETKNNKIYLDAYNANPSSMNAAILNFIQSVKDEKYIILGQMLELGKYSEAEHQKLIALLIENKQNNVIVTGEAYNGVKLPAEFKYFKDVRELSKWLTDNPIRGYSVLLKGSRGNKLENILGLL